MRTFLTRLGKGRTVAGRPAWTGAPGAEVVVLDADGRIEAIPEGLAARLGRTSTSLRGAPFAALINEGARGEFAGALAHGGRLSAALGEAGEPADLIINPDGARCAMLVIARAGAAISGTDAAARDAGERADLLADLSHEMKTPLNAVIGFAEAMESETFGPLGDEKYGEYAGIIRASGRHLLDLVTSILDLARIEANRFELNCEMAKPGDIARECAGIMRLAAEKAGLSLAARIDDDLPETWADPRALRQIILNLLSNAVKFTSDGGVALEASRDGDTIVLTVTDTGVGMSRAALDKLGARFTEAQGPGVRGARGTGLGLSLAMALADLHDGSLTFDSAPGEGVTATLRLPVRKPERPRRLLRAVESDDAVSSKAAERAEAPEILTQLERIEAYRRERRASAA